MILLGGEERFDIGHASNGGVGLACAWCRIGALRTSSLRGGVTAPFQRNGDLPSMHALKDEVFECRMSGPTIDLAQENALTGWVDSPPRSRGREGLDIAAIEGGSRLFFGEAQCATFHNGEMLTNNQTMDVGTGRALQVPLWLASHFVFPSCTLAERCNPACGGGEAHGHTRQLSPTQPRSLLGNV